LWIYYNNRDAWTEDGPKSRGLGAQQKEQNRKKKRNNNNNNNKVNSRNRSGRTATDRTEGRLWTAKEMRRGATRWRDRRAGS
jgi:hypothetical protein